MTSVHFLSQKDEWATPQDLYDELHAEFGFTLDVCATAENAKCPMYYTLADNGLRQPWYGVCWMNPPYGRQIGLWMARAYDAVRFEGGDGGLPCAGPDGHPLVVGLCPSRRGALSEGAAEVRRRGERRAFPVGGGDLPAHRSGADDLLGAVNPGIWAKDGIGIPEFSRKSDNLSHLEEQ